MTGHARPRGPHQSSIVDRSCRGTGLIGSTVGALIVVTLVLFATQVALHLGAGASVRAATVAAARTVAARTVDHRDPAAVAVAEAAAERVLAAATRSVADIRTVRWEVTTSQVRVEVEATPRVHALRVGAGVFGFDDLSRQASVHLEASP